jgi:hypothetical protein
VSIPLGTDPGDFLIRATVRLALAFYVVAVALMLQRRTGEWTAEAGKSDLARWCWSLACAVYLVHVGVAFHYAHGWSHEQAVRHVRDVSGVGEGIYASYLFTLLWTADVVFWWLSPGCYAARGPWIDRLLHGFLAFMIFNATVVFETGFIRWAGAAGFTALGLLLLQRRPWRGAPGSDTR